MEAKQRICGHHHTDKAAKLCQRLNLVAKEETPIYYEMLREDIMLDSLFHKLTAGGSSNDRCYLHEAPFNVPLP